MNKKAILYVDDEDINLQVFKALFRRDYNVFCAAGAEYGLNCLKDNCVDAVFTDQRMPKISGIEFLEMVREKNPDIPRIIISGYIEDKDIAEGMESGLVQAVFEKPYRKTTVENYLKKILYDD